MSPEVLHSVINRPSNSSNLIITPAILPSYVRHRVKDASYPAIVSSPSPEHSVHGTLVKGLTDADIHLLDVFEGDEYERRNVRVLISNAVVSSVKDESHGGEGVDDVRREASSAVAGGVTGEEKQEQQHIEAETYVWIAGEDQLEKQEWDFEHFVKQNMAHFLADEGLTVA